MSKILVVEDDHYLRRDIKEILEKNRYQVVTASTVAEAVHYVQTDMEIDLFLLDVWLPDGEGFEICTRIRKTSNRPVIFLTACDSEESVIKGLNLGGDDYVTKPFRTGELLSRIKANLRRMENWEEEMVLGNGRLLLDVRRETVELDGKPLVLRPVEYRILLELMKQPGRIVKREQLLSCLWDGAEDAVEDNTLSVHMSRLRGKIGNDAIETIRGFGYRFIQKTEK